jgi:hypothetical protein
MERQVWLEKIKRSASNFRDVPNRLKSKEFYIEAIGKNSAVYSYLPEESQLDLDVAIAAVKNGFRLGDIYIDLLANNLDVLWKAAIRYNHMINTAIQSLPLEMLTLEMCWEAIHAHPFLFHFVPEYMQTEDMAKYVATKNIYYLTKSKYDNLQWYMKMKNEGLDISDYFIQEIQARDGVDEEPNGAPNEDEVKEEVKDEDKNGEDAKCAEGELECVICMDNKRCMLFMPCRHVVSCKTCSQQLDKCPICKQQIKYKQQIIIS